MKFTRVKTTVMAGLMAASMLAPGMTAFAAETTVQWPTIKKTVDAAAGVTLPTKTADGEDLYITFEAVQFDADGDTTDGVIGNGDGSEQGKVVTGTTELKVKVADLTTTTKEGSTYQYGYASTEELLKKLDENGAYTFKITETSPIDKGSETYGWTIDSKAKADKGYYLHVIVADVKQGATDEYGTGKTYTCFVTTSNTTTTEGDKTKYDDKEEIGKKDDGDDSKKALFDVDNSYNKRAGSGTDEKGDDKDPTGKDNASLTISKTVSGNSKDYADKFEFEVTFETTNEAVTGAVKATGYSCTIGSETKDVKSGDKIYLKNGQTASFSDIPAGIKVKVVETVDKNVKDDGTSVVVTADGVAAESQKTTTAELTLGENKNDVAYTNEYKDITVTGVVTDIAPYVMLVVFAGAAVAAYVVMKARVVR